MDIAIQINGLDKGIMTGIFCDKIVDHEIAESSIYSFVEVHDMRLSVDAAAQYFLSALFMEVEVFNRAW